jgi:hypothetical protein
VRWPLVLRHNVPRVTTTPPCATDREFPDGHPAGRVYCGREGCACVYDTDTETFDSSACKKHTDADQDDQDAAQARPFGDKLGNKCCYMCGCDGAARARKTRRPKLKFYRLKKDKFYHFFRTTYLQVFRPGRCAPPPTCGACPQTAPISLAALPPAPPRR